VVGRDRNATADGLWAGDGVHSAGRAAAGRGDAGGADPRHRDHDANYNVERRGERHAVPALVDDSSGGASGSGTRQHSGCAGGMGTLAHGRAWS